MPLFDFFRNQNKKEPVKNPPAGSSGNGEKPHRAAREPVKTDPFFSPVRQKKRDEAAIEFVRLLQNRFFNEDGQAHAGTVLSVVAWLAGTSLYRSFHFKNNAPPGTIVLSEQVNEEWPRLMNLFAFYCHQKGIDLKPDQLVTKVPDEHQPHMDILQAQAEFQDQYNEIMKKHGLDYLEGAWAGVVACSIVFLHQCSVAKEIDVNVAAGIVSTGLVTGAKTSPAPLKTKSVLATPNGNAQENKVENLFRTIAGTSISGSGSRLVLGEQVDAIQEALKQGGKYILVHPQAAGTLQQNGIDPFIIHVTVLINEMEAKISQIDFVNADVDRLTQEWVNKPKDQAPMYVRQMLWLKANADKLGYQQNGNSWKLKQ